MKKLKLFEEYIKDPIPGDVLPHSQLHVFDFDDTLAVSRNASAIALVDNGNSSHKSYHEVWDWLMKMGLDKTDMLKGPNGKFIEETPHTKIWTAYIKSGALPKVSKHYHDKFITGTGEFPKGEALAIDFTPSAFVGRAKPIPPVIDKLKQLNADGANTAVLTARRGEGEGVSMDGKKVQASNIRDVKAYLKAHGAEPDEIYGVTGSNKGDKIRSEFFGHGNDPKEVHFYDDDEANIDSVKDKVAGKVDAEVFMYGPGKFDKNEADPNNPSMKFPAKKKKQ
jgi:hypothetical protein